MARSQPLGAAAPGGSARCTRSPGAYVRLTKDHEVVGALLLDRLNEAFDVGSHRTLDREESGYRRANDQRKDDCQREERDYWIALAPAD